MEFNCDIFYGLFLSYTSTSGFCNLFINEVFNRIILNLIYIRHIDGSNVQNWNIITLKLIPY